MDGTEEAAELGDLASVWRLARRLAETGLGPGRRVYRVPGASPMTVNDWKEELLNNFEAQEEEFEELVSREGRSGFVTYAKLHNVLETSKKRKTPHPWTMPSEIYKLLFSHVSDIGHFITNLASRMVSSSALPQVLCDASVLGIDKPEEKGVRVLCLLDASGKALSKLTLDFATDKPSTHQCGFAKKRDRRGPMVYMSAVTWRMRQMKRGFVIRLHDIVKAFYRVKHDCMEEWLLNNSPHEIATFLVTMHRRGRVVAKTKHGVASGRLRQGIRTGVTAGPRIFRGVHDDAIQKSSQRKETPRELIFDYDGKELDMSYIT